MLCPPHSLFDILGGWATWMWTPETGWMRRPPPVTAAVLPGLVFEAPKSILAELLNA